MITAIENEKYGNFQRSLLPILNMSTRISRFFQKSITFIF